MRRLSKSTESKKVRFYTFFLLLSDPSCIEATINIVMRLCGGKKKRKKKIYTKPKKIAHKHKKRPKALLEYFNVDNTGKISKLKIECEKCPAGN